jgi:hypothetical protein
VNATRPSLLLLLVLLCGPAPASADDDLAPSEEEVQAYLKALPEANQSTLNIGSMQVSVSMIPNYGDYLIAKDFLLLDLEDSSPKAVRTKVKQLAKRHRSQQGRVAIFLRFLHDGYRPPGGSSDFFAMESKLIKKITVTQVGRGKTKWKVLGSKGRVDVVKFSLFQAQSSRLFRGGNVPPVIKRVYSIMGKEYALDITLKKPVHKKTKRIQVRVKGFLHFSGNITKTQMDFSNGAMAEFVKGNKVEFRLPLEILALPEKLSALLAE